jgi:hypothetical protein
MDENQEPSRLRSTHDGDAAIRQVISVARAARQYVREAQEAQAAAGLSLPSGRELAVALDAGMKEFLAIVRKQVEQRSVSVELPTARVTIAALPVSVVVGGSGAMAPMRAAGVLEVSAATDTLTVQKDTEADPGMPLDAKTVFLAVLWALTIVLILRGDQLPQEVHDKIMDFLALVNFTLTIHWRVNDSRRKRD